jgi:hypothetical protein
LEKRSIRTWAETPAALSELWKICGKYSFGSGAAFVVYTRLFFHCGCLPLSGFPQSLQANAGLLPRTGHDHLLPNPFQFNIHESSYHLTQCSLDTEAFEK